jgi:hypothetical protein
MGGGPLMMNSLLVRAKGAKALADPPLDRISDSPPAMCFFG